MSTATLNGVTVTRARATLPRRRVWTAEAFTDRAVGLVAGDAVTLQISDLVLVGHVVRGGDRLDAGHYVIAGGTRGWRRKVRDRGYRNDAGVKLSKVVEDLARDALETVLPGFEERRLGPGWTRPAERASEALEAAAPDAWYVGIDGVTRIGSRPALAIELPPELVLRQQLGRGVALVALDEGLPSLAPETTVAGVGRIAAVTHMLEPRKLRSRLYLDGAA